MAAAGGGFVFNFDEDDSNQVVEPTGDYTPNAVPLHPLEGTAMMQLLADYATSAEGVVLETVCIDPVEDVATGASKHFLKHVVGVRVPGLQNAPTGGDDGADGDDAGGDADGDELRDIVPGQYLGGLKVWSCAVDLAKAVFAAGRPTVPSTVPRHATPMLQLYVAMRGAMTGASSKILELGCGHGLPGMAALACGATDVSFHDYNHEVLQQCLLPNICATFAASTRRLAVSRAGNAVTFDRSATVRAGSGEWASFAPAEPSTMEAILYDCILGADVTYDDDVTVQCLETVARLLKPGGMAFIGTKLYYFGTGGGRAAMEASLRRFSGSLELVLQVPTHSDGDAMHRCVVALRRISE